MAGEEEEEEPKTTLILGQALGFIEIFEGCETILIFPFFLCDFGFEVEAD